jgi:hypothetical protein
MLGLLLEGVEHVDDFGEADSVDGSVRIAVEVIDDLQYASAPKSLEPFGEGSLETQLRIPKRSADVPPDFFRETPKIFPTVPTQRTGLGLVWSPVGIASGSPLRKATYACSGIKSS